MPEHAITPFTVSISDEAFTDLRTRLGSTRWPEQLPGPAWQRGVPVDYLRRVADYWASDFDWRAEEKRINEFPQFTTDIDGQLIHFLHVRSAVEGATPLLLLHGWPGSFAEFLDVIESRWRMVAPRRTPSTLWCRRCQGSGSRRHWPARDGAAAGWPQL